MTVIARNFNSDIGLPYVLEDPDENQDRIWINNQGYVSSTLVPLYDKPNSIFTRTYMRPAGANSQTYPASVTYYAPRLVITNRGTITNNYYGNIQPLWSTYHWSLDYANYPNKLIWKSQNNRFIACDVNTFGTSTTAPAGGGYREYKLNDFTTPVTSTDSSTGWGVYPVSGTVYEDAANSRLYTFNGTWINAPGIMHWANSASATLNSYDQVNASQVNVAGGTMNVSWFFIGADSTGSGTYWAYMNSQFGTATEPFTLYKYVGATQTTVIAASNAGATTSYAKPFPSNVRRDSASRRVFYVPMFNATNELVPRRIVWDPTQINTATLTACTMTYASGTYATYSKKVNAQTTTFSAGAYNSWRLKGHQFKVGSNWYITFIGSDSIFSATRWPDSLTLTALTYSIGAGTADDQLTYHSGFTFTATTLPKDWIPINSDGNRLAIIQQDSKVGFMTFSESTGWSISSTYDTTCSSVGVDKYWRVWISSTDPAGLGNGLVHLVTPDVPITFTITVANLTYSYTGSDIATTATVNAYNYLGARVVTTADLTITGTGMIFTSNGTKSLSVTTSASADTTVNLTINGTGVSNIVATAAV